MENEDSFNLHWDDFVANTCGALKELREERDFCDVTLATDGKQVLAHKVILSGSSDFFQQILKQNPHPHPLLYLKGVKYDYLLSMLDFVYTGETNVNVKEIKSFLQVANDLQIKGLIEKNPSRKTATKERETIHSNVSPEDQFSDAETPSQSKNQDSKCTNIKVELDETIHPTVSFGTEANHEGLKDREDVMDLYEQKEDFSDDALRPNSAKLSDLPLNQPEFSGPHMNNCQEYHERKQVQVEDNLKTKHSVISSVERDDFSGGFDDKDCGKNVERDDFSGGFDDKDSDKNVERDDFSGGFDDKDCGKNVERDDFSGGFDGKDSDMTGSKPVDSPASLNIGDLVYAMQNNDQQEFKKCQIIGKEENAEGNTYQIRFEGTHTKSRTSTTTTTRAGTQLAYFEPTKSELSEKTRCIAIFEDPDYTEERFFPGIVAQSPCEFNHNRHLIFFDDGYNAYVPREDIREMVETVDEVWKDGPSDPVFIHNYFEQSPNNPVLRLAVDDLVETYLRDDEGCVMARVLEVDASLAKMDFGEDYEEEWIYLGSPRFKTIFDKYKNIEFKQKVKSDCWDNVNIKEEVDAPTAMADIALGEPKAKKRAWAFRKVTGRGGKLPRQEIKSKPLRKTMCKMANEALELEDL